MFKSIKRLLNKSPKLIPAIVLIIVWLALAIFNLPKNQAGTAIATPSLNSITYIDSNTETAYWTGRIEKVGPEQAYGEFKQKFANQNFGIQHYAAHIFGPLLYKYAGVKGVAICDQTFAFGCYHSFFGKAISQKGLSIVPALDQACVDKFGPMGTGCQHGIGHGLLEYYGLDHLVDALNSCLLTTQKNPLLGCTSGVFMEYNVPIIIDTKQTFTQFRKLDPNDPYTPCNKIPDRFRKSCYYEMGQWWDKVYNGDYGKLGKLCMGIDVIYQEPCYMGVGNVVAPSSNYEVKETIDRCLTMPDHSSQVTCQSGASWSFYAEPTKRSLSTQVCDGLSPDDQRRCVRQSDLAGERKNIN